MNSKQTFYNSERQNFLRITQLLLKKEVLKVNLSRSKLCKSIWTNAHKEGKKTIDVLTNKHTNE